MKRPATSGGGSKRAAKAKAKKNVIDVDTELAQNPMRPGPFDLPSAFTWANDQLSSIRLAEGCAKRFEAMVKHPWCFNSSYSGLRTEELAASTIAQSVHMRFGLEFDVTFGAACDHDPFCQALVLGSDEARQPEYLFKDIDGWLTPEAQADLDRMEASVGKVDPSAGKDEQAGMKELRASMYQEMGRYMLRKGGEALKKKNFCMKCLGVV